MMRALPLLVVALFALSLAPTAGAIAPDVSSCGFAIDPPRGTTDICVRVDILTPAGPSFVTVNATMTCAGTGQGATHLTTWGYQIKSPLGNPGLISGHQGSTLKLPYVCEF